MERYRFLLSLFREIIFNERIPLKVLKNRLASQGFIKNESNLRSFYNYIKKLEEEGLITSETVGREKIIRSHIYEGNVILSNEFLGVILYLLISPKRYQLEPYKEIIEEIFKNSIGENFLEFIEIDFIDWEEDFVKFEKNPFELLAKLYYFYKRKEFVSIYTSKGEILKLIPLKVFREDWKIYLLGRNRHFETVKVLLHEIKTVTPLGVSENIKPLEELPTSLREPFVFGVAFHKVYLHRPQIPRKMLETQFFVEENNKYYFIYLVGFTGDRFAQKFLIILYDEILEPSPKMLKVARSQKLHKKFKGLTYDLEENLKRFSLFLECLEKHLDLRNAIVKRKKLYMKELNSKLRDL